MDPARCAAARPARGAAVLGSPTTPALPLAPRWTPPEQQCQDILLRSKSQQLAAAFPYSPTGSLPSCPSAASKCLSLLLPQRQRQQQKNESQRAAAAAAAAVLMLGGDERTSSWAGHG
ncbi:hypothetical protein ACP70R_023958 [Stipagrostis hirtigluma subsp. patula]